MSWNLVMFVMLREENVVSPSIVKHSTYIKHVVHVWVSLVKLRHISLC